MNNKIYMAGCGGMLGEAFYLNFKDDYDLKCSDIDLNEDWLEYLDFRDFSSYRKSVVDFNPNYLFHLGAFTSLEYCENNSDETYQTNTLSVENAVYIANELDIPILYISTAGIFDGKQQTYDDWDQPNPLGVYARSKYMGERFVIENANRYLVCRAGWMMGGGPKKDKKFISKMMNQIKDGKKILHVVDDKDGTPTYTHDFALNVKALIKNEFWGLYNLVSTGQTSRFEVAAELLNILKLQNEIELLPVKSDFFKDEFFAERPSSERLINKKLELRELNLMRPWQESLNEYIKKSYKNFLND